MKIKLRKVKYKTLRNVPENYEEMEMDCQGTGTKEDPLVIEYVEDRSLNLDILEFDKYLVIKNCKLRVLSFYYSKNISVIDCKLRELRLRNCENIYINKVICSWIEMYESHNCSLIESRSEESINLFRSHNNVFKKCEFWNFFYDILFLSRNNIFEDNDVFDSEDFVFKSIQETELDRRNIYLINCYSNSEGYETREVICQGHGTEKDPYVIDSLESIDYKIKTIELFNKRDHLIFENINIKSMKLYDIKYVQFNNCNFSSSLIFKFCSEIKMDFFLFKRIKIRFLQQD